MPAAEYHRLPQLSNSLAKVIIAQSPLHAWTASPVLNPNFEAEEKEAFDIGSATHALLLEGEDRVAVIEADDWRKKAAQEQRDQARAEGRYPLLAHRYEAVLKMRDAAVLAIAQCAQLSGLTLTNGRAEHVLIWKDPATGVECRARVDFIAGGEAVFLDYKSTTDATPAAFSRQISRMGYHYQDEFYSRGGLAVFGKRPKFIFMAQETTPPHACSFHGVAPSLREVAARDVDYATRTWKQCHALQHWPSHDQRIHWAEAMPWQIEAAEDRDAVAGIPYDQAVMHGATRKQYANENDPA
jgi:hypothetical protein